MCSSKSKAMWRTICWVMVLPPMGWGVGVAHVGDDGRGQRRRVETDVLVEGVILNGDSSLNEVGRDVGQGYAGALALAEIFLIGLRRCGRESGSSRTSRAHRQSPAGAMPVSIARPVGIDQAAGGGRAANDDDQQQGQRAQQRAAEAAAAAAPPAGGGGVAGTNWTGG